MLQTPNLDALARHGTRFRRAYAEAPSCIPARRSLMSGTAPAANGAVGFQGAAWAPAHTMAGELTRAGYQTELIGKMHLEPTGKRYGFEHVQLADGVRGDPGENQYVRWLAQQGRTEMRPGMAHGIDSNGWVGRPHTLPEHQMHTFWCVDRALEFLETRDPTQPFFLHVSLIDPHPPLTPPQFYYERYAHREMPEPVVGDWVDDFADGPERGIGPASYRVHLDDYQMHCCRAAYYGMVNFIDDQIGRLFQALGGARANTFTLFTSDHGEMLGDHHLFRKTFPYEASARVPMLLHAPPAMQLPANGISDAPVGLQDVMPTLLDVAGAPIPESCTGRSMLPLMRGDDSSWRDVLHGEHAPCYDKSHGNHYLVDARYKYIWYSESGREQLFDLVRDPNETHDMAADRDAEAWLRDYRQRLIALLRDRPEGFTDGQRLIPGQAYPALLPDYAPHKRWAFV